MIKWTKNSWENFTVKHIPEYKDKDALKKALKKIEKFPPIGWLGGHVSSIFYIDKEGFSK